ncbi:MAG: PBP1A family penicillin-binding protein [Nitrospirota bacterium]|nr:PBP1A family penicillin-binding protein [Nitrospirota bacterium]
MPKHLKQAFIAVEDSRFYTHTGVDFEGIMRALWVDIRAREIVEGASTITQQLAKQLFLNTEKTFTRKIKEVLLAIQIEKRYSKDEILALYLNQIYLGSGAYGVEAAADIYFGKHAADLTLGEAAMLAGLPKAPSAYSPYKSLKSATARRNHVLKRMADEGDINPAQLIQETNKPVMVVSRTRESAAPYFVEYIRQQVEEKYGTKTVQTGGLRIYTSLDMRYQRAAAEAVEKGLRTVEARHKGRKNYPPLQGALLAVDPKTGQIRAMVGGRDFGESQFNRATQALRQPGSVFKPVVYAVAMENGFTPATIVDDSPVTYEAAPGQMWSPSNFTNRFEGKITIRRAIEESINVVSVRLLEQLGPKTVIERATAMGIRNTLQPYLSLALGASDVTLTELVTVFSVFANQGIMVAPSAIVRVENDRGVVVDEMVPYPQEVMKAEVTGVVNSMLQGVVQNGTAKKAKKLERPLAGKTGTTSDYNDAWFMGYTPSLVAGVWVGFDDHRRIGNKETGGAAALPIWIDFMKVALEGTPAEEFPIPDNTVVVDIDRDTGLLATRGCTSVVRQVFIAGTEPVRHCADTPSLHRMLAPGHDDDHGSGF